MKNPFLSVIVPAYNEAGHLAPTLRDIQSYLKRKPWSAEIIIVDDGSTDTTLYVAEAMMREFDNVRVLGHQRNRGKGAAVRLGMMKALGEIRMFTDADNSTSMDQFDKFLPYLQDDCDIVIGSRALRGSEFSPPAPFPRRLMGRLGNIVIQAVLLPGVWDTQCGFKVFRKAAAEKIFRCARIDGWGFDVEILSIGREFGFAVKEVPVRWSNSNFSHLRPGAYLQTLLEMFRIRWWLWKKIYHCEHNIS